jgi:hypothetical protein
MPACRARRAGGALLLSDGGARASREYDAEGRVVGIDVLLVSDLPGANPMELAYQVLRERAEKAA